MGSLKSPCTTSFSSIAISCLVFEKITFLQFGDRQTETDKQMDARSRSRCRERRLNSLTAVTTTGKIS